MSSINHLHHYIENNQRWDVGLCVSVWVRKRKPYTSLLMMSEWISATPLTLCEPTMQRWAMFTFFPSTSSIKDILRIRSISSGNRDAICYTHTQTCIQYKNINAGFTCVCGFSKMGSPLLFGVYSHPDVFGWSCIWFASVGVKVSPSVRLASAPEPQAEPCGWCMQTFS